MSLEHSPARAIKIRLGRTDKSRWPLLLRGRWPLLLRVQEAAFELRVSTRRVYQLIATGDLESVKIHKVRRVTSASVLRLAAQQEEVT